MEKPVIEIQDLSKYYGRSRGMEHVNLNIGEGEVFGFIGPNGAGKSTTIRILLNLIFPTSGHAKILGMDVIKQTREIKRQVGYIPSDANAYSAMKVKEFLSYCLRFHGVHDETQRITELAEIFELDPERKIAELSMGNRKKVSIVQSLLHRPRLLIVDEPTTGLDPLMQSRFFDLLRKENAGGLTIFYSSHILSEVQLLCKRVAIIKDGRIIQTEDIETLRKKQLKKVTVNFEEKEDGHSLNIAGIVNLVAGPGNMISFLYSGGIHELVALLAKRKILNLVIEEPSLEEIFMHYYK